MRAGMLSARQSVMPRCAKSRHTPARCTNTSCAVVVEVVLPGRYWIESWIQFTILRTRPMPGFLAAEHLLRDAAHARPIRKSAWA